MTKKNLGAAVILILFLLAAGLSGRADVQTEEELSGVPATINR